MREVFITGLGSICGLGPAVPDYWAALTAGHSAIRPLTDVDPGVKIRVGAVVADFQSDQYFNANELPLLDRFSQFAVISAREALADAGLGNNVPVVSEAAAIIGTGCGGKQTDEETYQQLYKQGRSRAHPVCPARQPAWSASTWGSRARYFQLRALVPPAPMPSSRGG